MHLYNFIHCYYDLFAVQHFTSYIRILLWVQQKYFTCDRDPCDRDLCDRDPCDRDPCDRDLCDRDPCDRDPCDRDPCDRDL